MTKTLRRKLHPDFRKAYDAAHFKAALAYLVDAPVPELARLLNAPDVSVTPLIVTRLSNLASVLDYTGPIFSDEAQS